MTATLHDDLCTFMISRSVLRMRNVSDKNVVEKTKTQIMRSATYLRKSCRLLYTVEKYCRAGQAIDENIIRRMRRIILHTHTHTHNIQNFLLSHATMVARTRHILTLTYTLLPTRLLTSMHV